MDEVPTWYAALGFALAAGVGLCGAIRALLPSRAAEHAFVRGVLRQLYAEGGYDDGVLVVRIDLCCHESESAFGWSLDIAAPDPTDSRHVWTASRAVLIRHLREHYRERQQQARREAA